MVKSSSYLLNEKKILRKESRRLIKQAQVYFQLERELLKKIIGNTPRTILDAGCGNGAYLSLLSKEFPALETVGFDRNERLLETGKQLCKGTRFELCDLTNSRSVHNALAGISPDFVILRFVLQHLSSAEVVKVLKNLKRNLSRGSKIIIIESAPSTLETIPRCEAISYLYERINLIVKTRGGNRAIASELPSILKRLSFRKMRSYSKDFGSRTLGWKATKEIFLPVLSTRVSLKSENFESSQVQLADKWFRQGELKKGYRFSEFHTFIVCDV
jgi:ubiquinone/menaquinone biosynthesis C-methylase UbiE